MAEPRDAGAAATFPLTPYQITVTYGTNVVPGPGTGSGWLGPLAPIVPQVPKEVTGRTWDFQAGYNLQVTPRSYEPVGFATLRMLSRSYDLMRLVIETRKDQMSRLPWDIKVKDDVIKKLKKAKANAKGANAKGGTAATPSQDVEDRIDAVKAFFERPDGVNKFRNWFRKLLEDVFVVDAPALYCQRTRGGQLCALVQLDGTLIKPVIDDWGRTPQPFPWNGTAPFVWNSRQIDATNYLAEGFQFTGGKLYPPAYQEVLKGIPAVDYTTRDIIYKPYNPQPNSPYGYSPVEQAIITVNIALRREIFTLNYFTEGNVPDALISVPETWTVSQTKEFQDYWDALLSGNLGQRRKVKFVPGGVGKQTIQMKDPELTGKMDEWLARVICFAFSISPQPFMQMMNRATAGTAKETAEEEGLEPVKAWWKELADDIIDLELKSPDLEWSWVEEDEIDPTKQETILSGYVKTGILTINMALERLGEDKSEDPSADKHMALTATGFVPIDAGTIEGKQANIAAFGTPDGSMPPPAPEPGGEDGKGKPGSNNKTVSGKGGSKPAGGGGNSGNAKDASPAPKSAAPAKGKAEVGKFVDAPFEKRLKRLPPVSLDRPVSAKAYRHLLARLAAGLHKVGKSVTAKVRRELGKSFDGQLAKVDDPKKRAKEIADAVDLAGLEALEDVLADDTEEVASDAGNQVLAMMGVEDSSDLVDLVNEAAADWARTNAAQLVSFDEDEDPMLAQTTRDMIRDTIADGLDQNIGMDAIAVNIAESTAFSDARAELIARTEIRRANSQGSLLGAKAARDLGVVMKKFWLTAGDDDVDEDICQPNEDQGAIDLDDDFESGDDAPPGHPRACFAGTSFISYGSCDAIFRARYNGPAIAIEAEIIQDTLELSAGNASATNDLALADAGAKEIARDNYLLIRDDAGGASPIIPERIKLTIGPHHPMLTARGWVRARDLNKGDELLYDAGTESLRAMLEPNLEKMPAFEDVFESVDAVCGHARIAGPADYFHGDEIAIYGEVEVVRPAGLLLGELDPGGIEKLCECPLSGAYPDAEHLASCGECAALFERIFLRAGGGMGRIKHAPTILRAGALPSAFHCARVTALHVTTFHGLAFDAATEHQVYNAGGLVVKNCRCAISYEFEEAEDDAEKLTKFDAGDITRDDHGRFSGSTGSKVELKESSTRAWDGEQVDLEHGMSKLELGRLGEGVAAEYLKQAGYKDVRTANVERNNAPVDIAHRGGLVEVKTGIVSNGRSAQQWRATIGQPAAKEAAWLRTASADDKREHNAQKAQAIIDRKQSAIAAYSKEIGHKAKGETVALLVNPDSKTVDVHVFDGFHSRIGWSSQQAKDGYVGSFKYR